MSSQKIYLTKIILLLSTLLIIGKSQACQQNTYSDGSGQCLDCDISCASCFSGQACSSCYDQMFQVTKGNKIVCDLCYVVQKGCNQCVSAVQCKQCRNGYYLTTENKCRSCNQLTSNCLLCGRNQQNTENVCKACKGIFVVNGRGTCSNPNQLDLDEISAVQNNLDQTETTDKSRQNKQPQQTNICKTVVINQKCVPQIAFCKDYSPQNGKCLECIDENVLNNSFCIPPQLLTILRNAGKEEPSPQKTTTPIICSTIVINKVCQPIIPFCMQYQLEDGLCKTCDSESMRINGHCIPPQVFFSFNSQPTKCGKRQFREDGKCIEVSPICINFTEKGQCTECQKGFYEFNGLCVQQSVGGSTKIEEQVSIKTTSKQNQEQLLVSSGNRCNSPCKTCKDDDKSACLSCLTGYTTVNIIPFQCFAL